MKHIRTLVLALGLLMLSTLSVGAQDINRPQFVIMDDYIRAVLIKDWDTHAKDTPLLERGYCVKFQLDFWADGIAYRVTQIKAAVILYATPTSIDFNCEPGDAEIHVHPAQTCFSDEGPCWPGGPYAYQCLPSPADRRWLVTHKQLFGMVQCSREATVFYWPTGDNR